MIHKIPFPHLPRSPQQVNQIPHQRLVPATKKCPLKDFCQHPVDIFNIILCAYFLKNILDLGPVISTARMHIVTNVPSVPMPLKNLKGEKLHKEPNKNSLKTWLKEKMDKSGRRQM